MHFHKWSKWSKPFNTYVTRGVGSFSSTRDFPVTKQSRTCSICQKVDTRYCGDGHFAEDDKPDN